MLLIKIRKRAVILDPKDNGARLIRDVFVKLVGSLVAFKNCGLALNPVDFDFDLTAYFVFPAITNTNVNPPVLDLNHWLGPFVISRNPSLLLAS